MIWNEWKKLIKSNWIMAFFAICILLNAFFAFRFTEFTNVKKVDWGTTKKYEEYQKKVLENAEKSSVVLDFSNEITYAKRNVEKTKEHYQQLGEIPIEKGPAKGVEAFFSPVTALLAFLFLLFVGYILFLRERENGIHGFLMITKKGRWQLCLSKLLAHVISAVAIVLVLYGENFLILWRRYGFGNLSRSLQSVYCFRSSGYKINIMQYLFGGVFLAIFLLISLSTVIDLLFTYVKSSIKSFIVLFLFGGVLSVLYFTTPLNSAYNWGKYCNPIFLSNIGEILGKYVNLNLFKYPVSYLLAVFAIYGIALIASGVLLVVCFSKNKKERRPVARKKKKKTVAKHSLSLFRHEVYRACRTNQLFFAIIILLALSIGCASQTEFIFDDEDEYYCYTYIEKVHGERTQAKADDLQKEYLRLKNLKSKLMTCSEDEMSSIQRKTRPYRGLSMLISRDKYLEKNNLNYYLYEGSYKKLALTRDDDVNQELLLISLVFIVCLLSSMFAVGREQNLMYLTTQFGRRKRVAYQLVVSLLICLLVFFVTWIPSFIRITQLFPFWGVNQSVKNVRFTTWFGDQVPMWVWVMQGYLKRLAALFVTGGITLCVSQKSRNTFTTILISMITVALLGVLIW